MNSSTARDVPGAPRDTRLRADAERNRDRILDAARLLFATEGLGVSMAAVAREAGVGKATLSRRFPTREDLITAVFTDRMNAYVDAAGAALADDDPWRGFCTYVRAVCAMQAADRGFADVLTVTFPHATGLEARRTVAYEKFVAVAGRAQAAGLLRPDFATQDLVILLMANAGVVAATAEAAPETWRRLVDQMLRAYATGDAPDRPLPPPPADAALLRAMARLARTPPADPTRTDVASTVRAAVNQEQTDSLKRADRTT